MKTLALLIQAVITVGSGSGPSSVGEAVAAASAGDTVIVHSGEYRERLTLDRPITLLGEGRPVLDGGGSRTVITVTARATIRGFDIRNSGAIQSREDSGILVDGASGTVIEDNRLTNVLFGIYLKETDSARVSDNVVEGKPVDLPLRGDGIRFWYSHDGLIADNMVRNARDVVIWFSDGTLVRGNRVSDSRYGLHFMYSENNRFENNVFERNDVGAFLMYSQSIEFRNNVFADARGTTGRGLGFKDTDRVTATGNIIVNNAVGLSFDNTPTTEGVENVFSGNTIAYNDVGVHMLPSVKDNIFSGNELIGNVAPIRITGGGTGSGNVWRGNFYSDYVGFDADEDGVGDTPYTYERLSDDLLARHEDVRVFALSPAMEVLSLFGRVLPLLAPEPLLVDSQPLLERPAEPGERRASPPLIPVLLILVASGALAATWRCLR